MIGHFRDAVCAAIVIAGLCLVAQSTRALAQDDVPPPSPYALPLPGLGTDPDADEPIRPWRHWGDNHNQGEFVKNLLAPDQVRPVPGPEFRRQMRYCRRHPDACDGY